MGIVPIELTESALYMNTGVSACSDGMQRTVRKFSLNMVEC